MKRKICFALVLVLVCAQLLTGTSYASYLPGDTVVYVTDYGEKYHNEGCGALWNSCYSISLYKAVQRGYTRCDRCWPGQLDPDWRPPESSPSPSPSPVLSPNPSPVPSPSPSRVLSPSTSPEPSETPFDLSKYPSYAAMQSGSPSQKPSPSPLPSPSTDLPSKRVVVDKQTESEGLESSDSAEEQTPNLATIISAIGLAFAIGYLALFFVFPIIGACLEVIKEMKESGQTPFWVWAVTVVAAIIAFAVLLAWYVPKRETVKYDAGYKSGHTDGYQEGHDAGYDEGYSDGYEEGNKDGYDLGHDDGYSAGEEAGYTEGRSTYDEGYDAGYEAGYDVGHGAGYSDGNAAAYISMDESAYDAGYGYGYDDGRDAGLEEGHDNGYMYGYDDGYDDGYEDGYDSGRDDGRVDGYSEGHSTGYDEGYEDGREYYYSD